MGDRYLVMGDNHGDTESLQRVLDDVAGESFDVAVHVGDFTRAMRDERTGRNDPEERGADQLRRVEPLLAEFDERARHGLVWVYGNQDYFGDLPYDLDVGTEVPDEGTVPVGGQRFTSDPTAVEDDVVLVTHMEHWSLLDGFDGRAHFCGNTHRGRHFADRLNAAFLRIEMPEEGVDWFGGYFLVTVGEEGIEDVELRNVGTLERHECPIHGERGVQFQPAGRDCMYCDDERVLYREMAATGHYGLTATDGDPDDDRGATTAGHAVAADAVAVDELVAYAAGLWKDPPADFRADFRAYLETVDEDRYSPLTERSDGRLEVAERSYAY